jgi:hypothetical protein
MIGVLAKAGETSSTVKGNMSPALKQKNNNFSPHAPGNLSQTRMHEPFFPFVFFLQFHHLLDFFI